MSNQINRKKMDIQYFIFRHYHIAVVHIIPGWWTFVAARNENENENENEQ